MIGVTVSKVMHFKTKTNQCKRGLRSFAGLRWTLSLVNGFRVFFFSVGHVGLKGSLS